MKKTLLSLFFLLAIVIGSKAQVAINTDGSNADPSAILDIKSAQKGLLIPRMTATERDNIASPAQGLMVYVTTDSTFYYYKKDSWIKIGKGAAGLWDKNGNYIYTMDSVGIGTTTPRVALEVHGLISQTGTGQSVFIGEGAGVADDKSDNCNVFVGYQAGKSNTTGESNTAIGYKALSYNIIGSANAAFGDDALSYNTMGKNNTATGSVALALNTSGGYNTAVGTAALYYNTTGSANAAFGDDALLRNTTGCRNTAIGCYAGYNNEEGSNNVFIGYKAGYHEKGSNKLYISNSSAVHPLIGGDFAIHQVDINGTLHVHGGQAIFDDSVGIGTLTPTKRLDVNANNDSLRFECLAGTGGLLGIDAAGNVYKTNGSDTGIDTTADFWKDSLYIRGTDTLMAIKDKGYVGIGTTTPGVALEVHGLISQTGTGKSVFIGEGAGIADDKSDNKNVFVGYQAGKSNTSGDYNTATGYEALYSNTTAHGNTAIGELALYSNTTAWGNTAIGEAALYSNTTGGSNTAIGSCALCRNNGHNNTAIGSGALFKNTTGGSNTAIGMEALYSDTTGNYNTANGEIALESNTTGNYNTAFGADALCCNNTGHSNTAIGFDALGLEITGHENIAIGDYTGHENRVGSDNIFIGHKAGYYETGSNKLYISNSDTIHPLIGGDFAVHRVDINGTLHIYGESAIIGAIHHGKCLDVNANNDSLRFERLAGTGGLLGIDAMGNVYKTNGSSTGIDTTTDFWKDSLYIRGTDTLMAIKDKGYVGIGTTTPGAALEVHGLISQTGTGQSVFIGEGAGIADDKSDNDNVFVGYQAGKSNTTGNTNTALGGYTLYSNTTGDNNTAIGFNAGHTTDGSGNIFIGYKAGYNETGSNKLYISNSDTVHPLIGGDFAVHQVNVNGTLNLSQKLKTPVGGDADMKPYIYGSLRSSDAYIYTGSSSTGFTAQKDGTGVYEITFDNYNSDKGYLVIANALQSTAPVILTYDKNFGSFKIRAWDLNGNLVDTYLNFVVIKK